MADLSSTIQGLIDLIEETTKAQGGSPESRAETLKHLCEALAWLRAPERTHT